MRYSTALMMTLVTFLEAQVSFAQWSSPKASNSSAFDGGYIEVKPKDLGWVQNPLQVCTQQIQTLVHEENRWCSTGKNGCELQFLASHGFSTDDNRHCQGE